ncbi:hypothetical protein AYL99_04537 [Fonsecaea erecta]|uniref:Nephrocystin 3-like N-terminal domain-containing protein n=1 Tax=Fonsecaea erecta TaxID=1367422 RepID=A0A178ZR69_9EURO|nr:hypothetical protein AYL99_04537 [Fonsecaea erecta]OAP62334.1 hypothetical protein AYL99_04537 [Fonsecaea erecta]
MLDPITALGVAGNVIQVVDFGWKVLSKLKEITSEGTLPGTALLNESNRNLLDLTSRLERCPPKNKNQQMTEWEQGILDANQHCRIVASKITALLQKMAKLGEKRFGALRLAISSEIKERDIHSLLEDLERVKSNLSLNLVAYLSIQRSHDLQEFVQVNESGKKSFLDSVLNGYHTLTSEVDELKSVVREESSTTQQAIREWQSQYKAAIEAASENIMRDAKECLADTAAPKMLASLYFVQHEDRRAMISEAHRTTFDWIFEDDYVCNSDRLTFSDWLKNEQPSNGLFFVNGKPGSGKSCLMRYLSNHAKLKALLEKWAGNKSLRVASAFFWRAGTKLQKSVVGILRTLLYQFLKQDSSLLPIAHPERWRAYYLGQSNLEDWSVQELTAAIARLFETCSSSISFAILVDGLDEYEGTDAQRQGLVDLFVGIASRHDNVKICVSSRPWTVFQEGFRDFPGLRLEDLTRDDVSTYVRDHLEGDRNFRVLRVLKETQCINLQAQIVDKASGVFLWVHLVVRDLLQCLQAGATIPKLFKRLDRLPAELDDFFMQIIETINPVDRAEAVMIFQLAATLPRVHTTALYLSYTQEEHDDFAFTLEAEDFATRSMEHRISSTKDRVNAICKVYDFFCESQELHVRMQQMGAKEVDFSRYICNASLTVFLALSAKGDGRIMPSEHLDRNGDDDDDDGGDPHVVHALETAITFLQYASQNDHESGSLPLSLIFHFRQQLISNWAWRMLRGCARKMHAITGCIYRKAGRCFEEWTADNLSFLKVAVQYDLIRYTNAQLGETLSSSAYHQTLDELVLLALHPLPRVQQQPDAIPSSKMLAILLAFADQQPLGNNSSIEHLAQSSKEAAYILKTYITSQILDTPTESQAGNKLWSGVLVKLDDAWADVAAVFIQNGLLQIRDIMPLDRQPLPQEVRLFLERLFSPPQAERLEDLIFRKEYDFVDADESQKA